MAVIQFGSHHCELQQGESVLDGLLRHGVPVSHACKAGSCGSCLLRASKGDVPPAAQPGLRDAAKARGYFLACVCRPDNDLTIEEVGDEARVPATVASLDRLAADVLRVRLACHSPFDFRPGQYVTLIREDGLSRSYSIASLPEEGALELHVRRVANGQMSNWLFDEAVPGASLRVQGPLGECFYVPGREDQPLLLVGTGTGLAPLYGIFRDALKNGHRGPIHLCHGATRPAGLYLQEELSAAAASNTNFSYLASVLEADQPGSFDVGPIDRIVAGKFTKLAGWRAFVCGDPTIVRTLKRNLFLAGIAMRDIYADAFLPSAR